MFKKIFKCKFHLRFLFTPVVRFMARRIGNYSGINSVKREKQVIISLTSYEDRFEDLELSLYSLLKQSVKPDRIILWLSDEYKDLSELPYFITRYIKNGLEIRFVKDIRSYTKIIYTLKEFRNSIIVTADDDIFYPKKWLEKLYYSYISYPNDIQVHRAHRVRIGKNGTNSENIDSILPYEKWEKHVKEESARYDNFLTGVGGVLYPPNCFNNEVLREDIFLKYSPFADDIWLWVMALVSNRKIRVVKEHIKTLTCIDFFGQIGLTSKRNLYTINKFGENDKQLKELLRLYGQKIISKINR